ncbi:hypothetical protein IJ670_04725 [bacterium]|nr:hypothetical protein [bacterium]
MNFNVSKESLKKSAIYGFIFGAILSVVTLIPIQQKEIMTACILILFIASAPCVLFYMKKNERIKELDEAIPSIIAGALIGTIATASFFLVLAPLTFVVSLIFGTSGASIITYMVTDALWLYIILAVVLSAVFGLTNGISAIAFKMIINFAQNQAKRPKRPKRQRDDYDL